MTDEDAAVRQYKSAWEVVLWEKMKKLLLNSYMMLQKLNSWKRASGRHR